VGASITVSLFGLLFGLAVLLVLPWQVGGESYAAITNAQSPAFFPILLSAALVVFSGLLGFVTLRGSNSEVATEDGVQASDEARPIESPLKVAAVALCLVLYYAALPLIGMIAASMSLILVMSYIMGFRNLLISGPVAVVIPFAIYLLFEKTLYVLLPQGKLF
jgi:hypothetical protein